MRWPIGKRWKESGDNRRNQSLFAIVIQRFLRHRLAFVGMIILFFFIVLAVFAPLIAPHDPYRAFRRVEGGYAVWEQPSQTFPLGTDSVGRCVLSRLIFASRVSLVVGLGGVAIAVLVGTFLGSLAGFFGGWVDGVIMRFTDTVICFPVLFLAITISAMLRPNLFNVMIIVGVVYWTHPCRLVRAEMLRLREMEFAEASVASGANSWHIIIHHLLPNALSPVIVAATLLVARAILIEASLSFLGVGVQQPIASWGNMLEEATNISVLATMAWIWAPPGLTILFTTLSIHFIGDGLRDALDPRLYHGR